MVKEIKNATNNTVEFGKRLATFVMTLLALAPVVIGGLTAWYGRSHISGLAMYAVLFTSGYTALAGLCVLYRTLMRKEK